MEKRRFRPSLYAVGLLVMMAVLLLFTRNEDKELFDKNSHKELYLKTEAGTEPELNAASYFKEGKYSPEDFSYDMTGCQLDVPGTYEIPVYYKNRKTSCLFRLEVKPKGSEAAAPDFKELIPPGLKEGGDETGITNWREGQ